MTKKEIRDICEKYNITNYTINPDGSIDVDDNVSLIYRDLTKIPIKFNRVRGYFSCSNNKLNTLEGSPNYVGDSFYCSGNKLTSLEGCPKVSSFITVHYNPLETLEGLIVPYDYLFCDNKEKLIRKHKLKILDIL